LKHTPRQKNFQYLSRCALWIKLKLGITDGVEKHGRWLTEKSCSKSINPINRILNQERVQTGSEAHPASYKMVIRGSFPGVKRPEREADHLPLSSTEVKEWVELYLHSPIRLHGVVLRGSTETTLPKLYSFNH